MGLWIAGLGAVMLLSGCVQVQTFNPNEAVFAKYYATDLEWSTSADVLSYLQNPETELLSQSERVAASWGDRDDGQTHWFNLVAFDDEEMTAERKYAFVLLKQRIWKYSPQINNSPQIDSRGDVAVAVDSAGRLIYAGSLQGRIDLGDGPVESGERAALFVAALAP